MQSRGGSGEEDELMGGVLTGPDGTVVDFAPKVMINEVSTSTLRELIKSAWEECIESDYKYLRINSERSLQASLWAKLNERLVPKESWLMFIEPGLKHERQGKVFPDIVVCDTTKGIVVAVIELKFQPRIKGKWKKDIGTLNWIDTHRRSLFVTNVRHDQRLESFKYKLAEDTLFVWAGIHLPHEKTVKELMGEIGDYPWKENFMEMHHPTVKRVKKSKPT